MVLFSGASYYHCTAGMCITGAVLAHLNIHVALRPPDAASDPMQVWRRFCLVLLRGARRDRGLPFLAASAVPWPSYSGCHAHTMPHVLLNTRNLETVVCVFLLDAQPCAPTAFRFFPSLPICPSLSCFLHIYVDSWQWFLASWFGWPPLGMPPHPCMGPVHALAGPEKPQQDPSGLQQHLLVLQCTSLFLPIFQLTSCPWCPPQACCKVLWTSMPAGRCFSECYCSKGSYLHACNASRVWDIKKSAPAAPIPTLSAPGVAALYPHTN